MEIGDASMKKKKYNWVKKVKLQHKIEHPCACGETVKLSLKSRAHECNCGIVWTYAPTMDEKKESPEYSPTDWLKNSKLRNL